MEPDEPVETELIAATLPQHLAGFLVGMAGPGYMLLAVKPSAPQGLWWAVASLMLLALLAWLLLFLRRFGGSARKPESPREALRIDVNTLWITSLVVIAIIATVQRYADQTTAMLGALFVTGTMVPLAIMTAREAENNWIADILPFGMPIAMSVFLVIRGGDHAAIAVAFILIICAVAFDQRKRSRRLIALIRESKQRAEEERDARLRFIASASHDLGQPLQSARLFLDQTLKGEAAARERAARNARWAFENAEGRLRAIIDHLRLDSGSIEARPAEVEAGTILARVVALHEPAARLAGIEVRTLPSSLAVICDAALAERALGNFLVNAIRHSGGRRVLLGAKRRGSRARLWVIDDGAGVAPPDQARLFEDYFQGSDHGDQVRGGFGLGLASARRMAGLMDGIAGHDPRWAGGSAFYLELKTAGGLGS